MNKIMIENKKSVQDVFKDFEGRQVGMIKALTNEVDEFFQMCDPEKDNLCLYAYPNGTWKVSTPIEDMSAELPKLVMGINYARDGTIFKAWLLLIAAHCDSWLIAVTTYFGIRFGFDKNESFFQLVLEKPTMWEVVNESDPKSTEENTTKNANSGKCRISKVVKKPKKEVKREEPERGDEGGQGSSFCGACGKEYVNDEFWICCDTCDKWYHGKCMNVTPKKSKSIKEYKCPKCQ